MAFGAPLGRTRIAAQPGGAAQLKEAISQWLVKQ